MSLQEKTTQANKRTSKAQTAKVRDFSGVKFAGAFRPYQQRVIDNSNKHFKDKRLHVVAAPGSGKTILGLELMRILNKPALILSPAIAIRQQWKERFADMFMPKNGNIDDFVSCSLLKPSLLTSITYQGLYTAFRKTSDMRAERAEKTKNKGKKGKNSSLEYSADAFAEMSRIASAEQFAYSFEHTEDGDVEIQEENYSAVDIVEMMEKHQISTICLDEAHHLRAEWQKALQEFIEAVGHKVTVIALTATPPYDSKKSEWDKYIAVCGPIDEEIFVPELVRARNLCPHQDYIYYSFPTKSEIASIQKYQQTVQQTAKTIFLEGKFLDILTGSDFFVNSVEFFDELADKPDFVKAVIAFLKLYDIKPPSKLKACLENDNRNIVWDLSVAQTLFQAMMSDDQFFDMKNREFVKNFLSRAGLVERGKVCLLSNEELEKLLLSSIGKLHSISTIVDEEYKNLKDNIRLLVLTDYIKVNSAVLASDKEINELGVVPVFELLRRKNNGLKLAALSGKVVLVPSCSVEGILQIAQKENARVKVIDIANTSHCELKFEGSDSSQKIGVITKAFNAGIINGIVGTKSLLGEGWDSPVINTLILASYVGSFMLSNQMRGRAIRIDKNCPEKVSNIWHLTAILPQHLLPEVSGDIPPSADYATLERRFHGFMGINYRENVIESSLSRACTLNPPYDQKSIDRANKKSLELAKNRQAVSKRWGQALKKSTNEVVIQNEIPQPTKGFFPTFIFKPSHFRTVKRVAYAVIRSFKELQVINKKARPLVEKDKQTGIVNVGICRCSQHEKNVFHQAIGEVLGAIDNPRYVLVKTKNNKLDFRACFAVPDVFSVNKDNAEVFRKKMSIRIANFGVFYTRSNDGKKILSEAKRKAYINKVNAETQAKMKLRPR